MQPPETDRWTLDPELERWLLALCRVAIIGLSAAILNKLYLPVVDDMPLKQVVIAVTAILLSGKCLFDTLFFDRRQP